jgi:hypothetical protein
MGLFQQSRLALAVIFICVVFEGGVALAQSGGSSVSGIVVDPSDAVVANAKVEIHNAVSGFDRTTLTGPDGRFSFPNVPFNPYHMTITAQGFTQAAQDVEIRSALGANIKVSLAVASSVDTVTVEAGADLVETDSTAHTDVDRGLFDKIPQESASSSVSSLVTLATPGVAADSNGLFHGMGDHGSNSFSVDGQPITDQQSKVFSNQIPVDSIQSLEVIQGAPPAEYGGKTSLVIVATTRSGQDVTTPHGSITASYGSFGSSDSSFELAYGDQKWGNFISINGLNTGRFLDGPEFAVMHDKGNEENLFDRIDYQISDADTLHLNLGYSRSWFQNPNSYDQEFHFGLFNPVSGAPLSATDQRQKIGTYNIAPTWTHVINPSMLFTFGGFVRHDSNDYYPSANPFSDFSPDLQSETAQQARTLTNAGLRSDITYSKGIHNLKAGLSYQHTFLTENEEVGIVDPAFYPAAAAFYQCLDSSGNPLPGTPCAALIPYDLTRGGSPFQFHGHTDVKETALYVQDMISKGRWSFNLGIRGDLYNGLSIARQAEPRLGIAYNIKPTNTVLRISYARTLESPFNENLVIASTGCNIPFLAALVPPFGVPCNSGPITAGYRNEFHAGLQQALGRYLVFDGEYLWKYTHNGYDFGVLGNTPITCPIEWRSSKIPGFTARVSVPNYHGFTAFVAMSSVAARFFLPQVAGLPIVPPATGVFRIDHDEKFNQTTHFQYQPWKTSPWIGFNWRYDSGSVAGAVPCYNPSTATCAGASTTLNGQPAISMINTITGAALTADQEFQAGFTCAGARATITQPLPSLCPASQFGSSLVSIPAPNRENDDHNPQRIRSRNLFDVSVGDDNLFHGDKRKWSAQLTVINVTNKLGLYNFLSTFSGTHYVTPRTLTAQIGFHF